MPENNFEKRVQQKMEELRLPPSAEVWEEVEKRIRKEKKRRRIIFWFFLFGALLLGGAGWWAIDANKKQIQADNSVVQTAADKKTNDLTPTLKDESDNKTIVEIKPDSNNKNDNLKTETQITNKTTVTEKETVATKKELPVKEVTNSKVEVKVIDNSFPDVAENISVKKEKQVLPAITRSDEQITVQKNAASDSITKADKMYDADTNKKTKDSIVADKPIVSNNPADITKPALPDTTAANDTIVIARQNITKTKENKWEFGINGMVGSSKKSKDVSIFNNRSDALNAQPNSQPGTGSPTGTPIPRILPSSPGSGFSWEIGTYVKRKINAGTGISIGLNFASYSTTQLTGAFVDSSGIFSTGRFSSSVQDFYRSGSGATYTNHYYYLQIPVSFHWQINKSVKLPLIFQNGLSLGIFTGSDALVYNSSSNVFFKDNKSFNKIQISYQSGLNARLFNRSKRPLSAGILYNYHLSKLQKVNINGGNHLSSFGFQLGWLLKK